MNIYRSYIQEKYPDLKIILSRINREFFFTAVFYVTRPFKNIKKLANFVF